MAALEKIRKRAVILTIVIGAGLLAFILEEAVRASGAFRNDTTVAKVGSEKIDYEEFSRESSRLSQANQNNRADIAMLQANMLNEMVMFSIIDQECKDAAISVSQDELSKFTIGEYPTQSVSQFAQQQQLSPQEIYDVVTKGILRGQQVNPSDPNVLQLKQEWNAVVAKAEKEVKTYKVGWILQNCLQPNALDRQLLKNDLASTFPVQYAKKNFSGDDKYAPKGDELKKEYEQQKNRFRINQEMRLVHFIAVPVAPSAADEKATAELLNNSFAALQQKPQMEGVKGKSNFRVDSAFYTAADMANVKDSTLKVALASSLGTVVRGNQQGRSTTFYKVLNQYTALDSVKLDFVAVEGDKKLQDTVLNALNSGTTLADIVKINKDKIHTQAADENAQAARGYMFPDTVRRMMANAGSNFFVYDASNQGAVLARVASSKGSATFTVVGVAQHTAVPSQDTRDDLRAQLQQFINKNKTAAAFEKNAEKNGYNCQEVELATNTAQLMNLDKTRKAIQWAFNDAKKGDVSNIFTDNKDFLIAMAVDQIYDGEFMPLESPVVKEMLTARVKNSKEAAQLLKQYGSKKDVADFAAAVGATVMTDTVSFAGNNMNIDGKILGMIAGSKPGKYGPVAGETGVYVFNVGNKVAAPVGNDNKMMLNQQIMRSMPIDPSGIIFGSRKVKINAARFF